MPKTKDTYRCMCSKCYAANEPRYYTKRTVETHIRKDRAILQSTTSTNTDLIDFLELRIQETLGIISGTHGGSGMPDTASDREGSHRSRPADSEHGLDSEGTQI